MDKPWKVPFVNYGKSYLNHKREFDDAIQRCLENGDLVYREDLIEFEKEFAAFCGCKYGIGTGSCTGAMFIALKAIGIKPGDEVITVSHTYIATIDVIKACGATAVLIDVEQDSMNMDPMLIERNITSRTKAIMPVHLNGRMCDMYPIMKIANQYGLKVIEDAAQAVGASYDGKPAGSFSDIGCFSFYPAKNLGGFGEGGMAITNDKGLADVLYCLRDHGEYPGYMEPSAKGAIFMFGYNTILDNLMAAVLRVKMRYIKGYVARRRTIALDYFGELDRLTSWLTLPGLYRQDATLQYDAFQNYVIRTNRRDELQTYLADKGIETMVHWRTPNHKQAALRELHKFNLPVTEKLSNTCLSLPCYTEMSMDQVNYVIRSVQEFFKQPSARDDR